MMFSGRGHGFGSQLAASPLRGRGGQQRGRGNGPHRGRGGSNSAGFPKHGGASLQNGFFRQNRQNANGDERASNSNQDQDNGGGGSRENRQDGRKYPFFGFKKLYGFLSEPSDSVILAIEPRLEEWGEFIENKMVEDILVLVIHVLGEKVVSTESVLHQHKVNIVSKTINEVFCIRCNEKTQKMLMSGDPSTRQPRNENDLIVDHSRERILRNLHNVFTFVVNKMVTTAIDYVQKMLGGIIGALMVSHPSENIEILKSDFLELRDIIVSLTEKRKQEETQAKQRSRRQGFTNREEEWLHGMEPPDDFHKIPIVPPMEEIMSLEETFLRPNKKYGSYNDAEHYLDVHFRLLREDFMKPLKTGIQDFLKHKHDYLTRKKKMPIGNVRIYPDVQILGAQLVKDGITYKVQLPENIYKRINWERSKRLLPGSMVVFTSDDFYTAYFGVVAQHDRRNARDLSNGMFDVIWEGASAPTLEQKGEEFLMIECEVYFEAYRHTLQILQEIKLEEFPLAKFIVQGSPDVGPPEYMSDSTDMVKLDDDYISPLQGPWPTAKQLSLDETQFEAFHSALTKEFAIIQGPPGTGKTFLGLKIAEVLLNNLPMWWGEDAKNGHGPILVVCFTNHALDQFLEGILALLKNAFPDEDPAMIRVGGRSKSDVMQEYSLARKRQIAAQLHLYDRNYWTSKRDAVDSVRDCEYSRAEVMQEVAALSNLEGIIDFTSLQVWERTELEEDFPPEVWQILKDPSQLGIKEFFFQNSTADQLFNYWFQLRSQASTAPQKPPQNQRRKEQDGKPAQAAVDEDDEDYDLEELLENRCVEDICLEFEASSHTNEGRSHVKYVNGTCVKEYEKLIRYNVIGGAEIDKDTKIPNVEKAMKRTELEQRNRIIENMKLFMEKVLIQYKVDMIDLPAVTNILNPKPGDAKPFSALTYPEKWALYFAVVERARVLAMQLANTKQQKLIDAQKKLKDILTYGDGFLLRRTKVVGMTTTGAAKYNDLLRMMKSKIVIVEEAAEVLEAHIVTCITEHCQHLILIGDHQQLKPSTTVYELAKKYNLDISLFERMLNNNLHCSKLKVQHRMRPEICDLIVGSIYDELDNHVSVRDYDPVLGTAKNLFFISHDQKEKSESDTMSKQNPHEAKFLASLCRYLVQQGYATSRITIITTYTGQMFLLKKEVGKFPTCKGVRVTVVDNFQGEENDIILLSLVRSNDQNKIGFLKTDNRICVAISRAKHGLFICGNMDTLIASKSKTWEHIQKKLLARNEIGDSLELVCQIHRTSTLVKLSTDFSRVPEGGCNILCATNLTCGHSCESVCHIHDREHKQYKCKQQCLKRCKNNHPCQDKCFKDCPPCPVKMIKRLPCEHDEELACHVNEQTYRCMEIVPKVLPCDGKHVEELPCSKDPKTFNCKMKVTKKLPCGHEKKNTECYIDASTIKCKVVVDKILIPCLHSQREECHLHPEMVKCKTLVKKKFDDCGHTLDVECQYKNKPVYCKTPCQVRLDCGHACARVCHFDHDPDHLTYECRKDCGKVCVNGHECSTKHRCSKPCPPCEVSVEKTMLCGVHKTVLQCSVDPSNVDCLHACDKIIPRCEHKCGSLCFQPCEPCMIRVEKSAPCGHRVEVPCSENATQDKCETMVKPLYHLSPCNHDTLVPCKIQATITLEKIPDYCTHPCGYEFKKSEGGCEHRCAGTCAECRQGRLHIKCQEVCERPLVCGHVCKAPCAATSCPPCKQECVMKCEHSACNKICGEPCTGCAEPCNWRCEHKRCPKKCRQACEREPCDEPCRKKLKCDHECIGFCGEPCPPQCRVCDKEELSDFILLGNEDEEDARFVLLEDCGHAIEHEGLQYHLACGGGSQNGEILAKTCPKCKTVIRRSRRYGNLLRDSLKDVLAVKAKVYGKPTELKPRRVKIIDELLGNMIWKLELPRVHKFILDKLILIIPANAAGKGHKTERIMDKSVDVNTLTSLEKIVEHGLDVLKLYQEEDTNDLSAELRASWKSEYEKLFQLLIDRVPLNKIEVRDFDREFERLHDLRQVFLRKSSPRFTPGHSVATPIYQRVLSIIWAPKVYTKDMKDVIIICLKEIDDCIKTGLGISDRERREILSAIGMASGRWFKCPNGHIYVIGDCGGAVREGRCNECGAAIGGGNYRLRSDNAIATEMDGATQPLYPGMV